MGKADRSHDCSIKFHIKVSFLTHFIQSRYIWIGSVSRATGWAGWQILMGMVKPILFIVVPSNVGPIRQEPGALSLGIERREIKSVSLTAETYV
jgi:hypothetical protein